MGERTGRDGRCSVSGPKHVGNVGKWRLLRWEYEGAPLMAEHPAGPLRWDPSWTVEIDEAGDLEFDGLPYEGSAPCVPGEVLSVLVDDAIARNVWGGPLANFHWEKKP